MYIKDGIAYAGELTPMIAVSGVRVFDDMIMLVTFDTGEQRVFDATILLDQPAFQLLKDTDIFRNPKIEYGVVTWDNGRIDIAPETMYKQSYAYESRIV